MKQCEENGPVTMTLAELRERVRNMKDDEMIRVMFEEDRKDAGSKERV